MNKLIKILLILAAVYVAIVVVFESWLGYAQPRGEENLVITVTEDDGSQTKKVLSLFQSEDELYLAANHWPRAWFRQVQKNPNVHIEFGGEHKDLSGEFTAIPVEGADHDRVLNDNRIPFVGRFLMGFPPREFVRIEPVTHIVKWLVLALLGVAAAAAIGYALTCPCERTPGIWVRGEAVDTPVSDWSFANEPGLCELQVNNWLPHAITLNCMSTEQRLFVSCANCEGKYWSTTALNNPVGKIKIGDRLYPVKMRRVTDPQHLDKIWLARAMKTGRDAAGERPGHWWSFELESVGG